MARQYVDLIAKSIEKFDTRNHNNPDVKFEHYVALAWVGLQETKVYTNLNNIEKNRIVANRKYFLTWYSALNCN